MFLPTVLMGLLLPLAGRLLVGSLYAVNTLGCVVGAAVTGFALVPWLGIQKSIVLLCGLQVLLGSVLILSAPELTLRRRLAWVAALAPGH